MAKARRDLAEHKSAQELGLYDETKTPVAEQEGDGRVLHNVSWGEPHVKITKTAERLKELGIPQSRWWRA